MKIQSWWFVKNSFFWCENMVIFLYLGRTRLWNIWPQCFLKLNNTASSYVIFSPVLHFTVVIILIIVPVNVVGSWRMRSVHTKVTVLWTRFVCRTSVHVSAVNASVNTASNVICTSHESSGCSRLLQSVLADLQETWRHFLCRSFWLSSFKHVVRRPHHLPPNATSSVLIPGSC